jgi:dihydroxyacetone kinase-like predicted kinase
MNPSTQDFMQLLDALPTERAILLPNNSNVIMAARQTVELCKKQIIVVPTKTIPQGIAAMLAFNEQRDLEANARAMEAAAKHVKTGEVTTATRSVEFNGLKVEQGQIIGLLNDELTVAAPSVEEAVWSLLDQMGIDDLEIVTLYFGNQLTSAVAEGLADAIRGRHSNVEVEVVEGGQPHYDYIISAE